MRHEDNTTDLTKGEWVSAILGCVIGVILGCIALWFVFIKPLYDLITNYTAECIKFVVICWILIEIYRIWSHSIPPSSDK